MTLASVVKATLTVFFCARFSWNGTKREGESGRRRKEKGAEEQDYRERVGWVVGGEGGSCSAKACWVEDRIPR